MLLPYSDVGIEAYVEQSWSSSVAICDRVVCRQQWVSSFRRYLELSSLDTFRPMDE